MKLVEIKFKKFGKEYVKKGAYIFTLKKNGERYAHPCWNQANPDETTQEEVLARIQRLNPKTRFELAGIEDYREGMKLQY